MKPNFDIQFSERRLSEELKKRVISIRVTDSIGVMADSCEIEFDDHDLKMEIPEKEALITVFLGYGENLSKVGSYFVDDVTLSSDGTMRVFGVGFNQRGDLKTVKSKVYSGSSLYDVLENVGKTNNVEIKIDPQLKSISVNSEAIEQRQESLIHFLTRLSDDFDLTFKVQGDVILIKDRLSGKSYSGAELEPIKILREDVLSWSIARKSRESYKSVVCNYYDCDEYDRGFVVAGEGAPVLRIRETFATKKIAEQMAKARLKSSFSEVFEAEFSIVGDPNILADCPIEISGFKEKIDKKKWMISRSNLNFVRGSFVTIFSCVNRL